jgi:hypothetical protein
MEGAQGFCAPSIHAIPLISNPLIELRWEGAINRPLRPAGVGAD